MNEYDIIKRCIDNDATCQRLLFEQHAGKMMTICLRYAHDHMEAEDILQDAFIKVYTHLHQFKFEGSFEGWVRRIVVNTALKHIQKNRIKFDEVNEHKIHESLPAEVYTSLNEKEIIGLISQLPDGYRVVFNLFVIEGYSHD